MSSINATNVKEGDRAWVATVPTYGMGMRIRTVEQVMERRPDATRVRFTDGSMLDIPNERRCGLLRAEG